MGKFSTEKMLVLEYLLEEYEEDLRLSIERYHFLKKDNEQYLERGYLNEAKKRVKKVKELIKYEKTWSSSAKSYVEIGHVNLESGDLKMVDIRFSGEI